MTWITAKAVGTTTGHAFLLVADYDEAMIYVHGEALIDLVPEQTTLNPATGLPDTVFAARPGGGPFNAARAAAKQGGKVRFISRISTDDLGERLLADLNHDGVDTTQVERGPEPTSLAVTSIGADGSANYSFYFEGTADRLATPKLYEDAKVAAFGTCSLALEPAASRYAKLMKAYFEKGVLTALDPNIRPLYEHTRHQKFLRSLLPYVTCLKVTMEELAFLGPEYVATVPVVLITDGENGMKLKTKWGIEVTQGAYPVEVSDTIGAGDTVFGTMLTQLAARTGKTQLRAMSKDDWQEVLRNCAAAAAITVTRQGAHPPTATELTLFRATKGI